MTIDDDKITQAAKRLELSLELTELYGNIADVRTVLDELARLRSALPRTADLSIVAAAKDNEATAFPWWAIVKKVSFGYLAVQAGPWFSREAAENYLAAKRYNYPKAFVFCFSGHESQDFRKVYAASRAAALDAGRGEP